MRDSPRFGIAAPPATPSHAQIQTPRPHTCVWKTHGADGTTAAVEVAGIDPSNLAVLKCPAMTLEHWTSFLTVRVAHGGPDETKTAPPLWGSYP